MRMTKKCFKKPFTLLVVFMLVYVTGIVFVTQIAFLGSVKVKELTKPNGSSPLIFVRSSPQFASSKKSDEINASFSENHQDDAAVKVNNHLSDNETLARVDDILYINGTEYVDWNDYVFMAKEAERTGPGEQGKGFKEKLSPEEQEISNKLYETYNFNAYASDHISVERAMGDIRTDVCKVKKFMRDLPEHSVSVVSIFHNERYSTILRTLHSIVNRSPARLLREIILVDDVSSSPDLKGPLDDYIRLHFKNVTIIRNENRLGLIKSRMAGADASTGEFLLFLDAHVEVNHNYLPPLVEPIVQNYKTIVCPMMDIIHEADFSIRKLVHRERGAFSWDLVYRRLPVFQEDETKPHPVPSMLGAAFIISRRWWEELGKYDTGLEIWGGEQYEITFKSWQCGGSVVDAPCSRVAHLYRRLPYVSEVMQDNLVERNFLRVVAVWMDEYQEYVFQRRPLMRQVEPGDLSEQFALRKRLNCKPFKWYLTEVAPDILKFYPPVEPPPKAWGRLRSTYNHSWCVVTKEKGFAVDDCHSPEVAKYEFDWRLHIRHEDNCFANPGKKYVFMYACLIFEHRQTQKFVWDQDSGHIVNVFTHFCIDVDNSTREVYMAPCNSTLPTQSWTFDNINSTLVAEAWNQYMDTQRQ